MCAVPNQHRHVVRSEALGGVSNNRGLVANSASNKPVVGGTNREQHGDGGLGRVHGSSGGKPGWEGVG